MLIKPLDAERNHIGHDHGLSPDSARMATMRGDNMMQGVPPRVVDFQAMFQARSRVVILRQLLDRPMTFPELRERVNMSTAAVREGVNDLEAAGYVTDDSPEGLRRKPTDAVFSVDRDKLMTDLSETIRFLAI